MKLESYYCDKCGDNLLDIDETNYKWSLQVYFPNMSYKDVRRNLGIRHLCTDCRDTFISKFHRWFSFYNKVAKGKMKKIHKEKK